MLPLRKHVGGLEPEAAAEQLLGLVGRLTTRLAVIEYEEKVDRLKRKSEQLDPKQLALALDELEAKGLLEEVDEDEDPVSDEEVEELIKDGERQRKDDGPRDDGRRKHRRLPARLPRVRREADVPEKDLICPCCRGDRVEIGRDVHERLDLAPIRFQVLRFERIRRACPSCKDSGVVVGPPPRAEFERLLASVGLMAWVVAAKYDTHLPLYRLQKLCRQMGCSISDSTLGGWASRAAREMRPVVDAMWEDAMASWLVGTDATGHLVLDRDAPGGSRLGQMWCYLADARICVFRYAPNGEGINGPWKHLTGRTGYIQADAAGVFDRLFNGKVADAVEVGCMAHARRKLEKLLETDKRVAWPLKRIQQIFRVEKAARLQGMGPADRLQLRRRKSVGAMERLRIWLVRTAGREPPKSALAGACAYWINHWEALTRFLFDGRIEIDNTAVEREMRSIALGRKNSLFVGSDRGGHDAAVLYSLMRTCTLNEVDPIAYLTDVLGKIAAGWPQSRIAELCPHRWVQQPEQDAKAEVA